MWHQQIIFSFLSPSSKFLYYSQIGKRPITGSMDLILSSIAL